MGAEAVAIRLSANGLLEALGRLTARATARSIDVRVPARATRAGGQNRMLTPDDKTAQRGAARGTPRRALARAHDWAECLTSGRARSINEIAREDGVGGRCVARLLPLGFLAPAIVERLTRGEHPRTLTAEALTRGTALSASWDNQLADFNPIAR